MEKKNVIYHIGLPKTGTTFLQKAYFPNLRGDYTYIKRYPRPDKELTEWTRYVRMAINDIVPASSTLLDASTVIYSNENISDAWLQIDKCTQPLDMVDIADRMLVFHKFKFGETHIPHILIGFRNFETWTASYYAQSSVITDFDKLLDTVEREPARYSRHVIEQCFRERFSSIFVYDQEEISRDLHVINNWFKGFGLDGQHIVSREYNRRSGGHHNQYHKRFSPFGERLVKLHVFCRKLLLFSGLYSIASRFMSRLTRSIEISDSQLERARRIGKKLDSLDAQSSITK